MRHNKKICLISSSGGHLEQIKQLKKITSEFEYYYIVNKTSSTSKIKEKKYLITDIYRGKNKLKKIAITLYMFTEQFFYFIKERPDVVITTGAGMVVPTCLIAKIFRKKVVYIESFARMTTANKTGKFLYKFADLFIIQWPELKKIYPKAEYWGWIY